MTRPLLALAPLLLVGCLTDLPVVDDPCGEWPEPGLFRVRQEPSDTHTRRPYVYVPSGEGPRDLVFLLHGGGSNAPDFAEVTGMLDFAEKLNTVVVYPDALGFPSGWNAGPQYGFDQDDLGFLEALANDLDTRLCGRRKVALGFSNGAMMAHRWACEGTELDAIGVSSGPLMLDGCDGDFPLPVRHYHGEADTVVPIDGGVSFRTKVPPLDDTIEAWKVRNQCSEAFTETVTGDTTCRKWDCAAPTEFCTIADWPHMWPGGVNASRTDADATTALLGFFDRNVPRGDEDEGTPTDTGATEP